MIWLKSCAKCNGDLVLNADIYGSYVYCFQCGLIKYPPAVKIEPSVMVNQRVSPGGRHLGRRFSVCQQESRSTAAITTS